MQEHHFITWKQYENVKKHYPHISSFAYWPETHRGNEADPIIAETEEEFYQKGLDKKLHADVVFLGSNFGIPKDFEKRIESENKEEILQEYKKLNHMSNQYGGKYGKKGLYPFFRDTYLEGSYMTDLYKFPADDTDWTGYGIPTKSMKTLSTETLIHNIHGLAYELREVLGVKRDPIFILLGDFKKTKTTEKELKKVFRNSKIYKYLHYAAVGKSKKEFGERANQLLDQISKDGTEVR